MLRMTYSEFYTYLKHKNDYKTAGDDVQYHIQIDTESRIILLCFEETISKFDWKVNLDFPSTVYKRQKSLMLVHRGYVKAWKSANDQIMNELLPICEENPDCQLIIGGWSYGGAMSLLAAEDFNFRTGKKAIVVTYGAPKICYFYFTKKHFLKSILLCHQFVRINDFVTWCIPFPWVHHVRKSILEEKFSFKELFRTDITHCNYQELL